MSTASILPILSQRLSQHLAVILGTLRAVLAAGIGREPARVALLLLAWPYLHRVEARFASLVARVVSGRFAVATPRPGAAASRERGPRPSLPRRFGWMTQLTPAALPLASQVRHWLADPEFSALLAAAPEAGRILRPLCRMLGIAPGPDLPPALLKPPERSALTSTAAKPQALLPAPAIPDDTSPILLRSSAPRLPPPLRPPRLRPEPA